jgi:hypothetical protein
MNSTHSNASHALGGMFWNLFVHGSNAGQVDQQPGRRRSAQ